MMLSSFNNDTFLRFAYARTVARARMDDMRASLNYSFNDERRTGTTKYNARRMVQLGMSGILSFSTVPLRIAIYAGFALAAFGAASLLWVTRPLLIEIEVGGEVIQSRRATGDRARGTPGGCERRRGRPRPARSSRRAPRHARGARWRRDSRRR